MQRIFKSLKLIGQIILGSPVDLGAAVFTVESSLFTSERYLLL